MAFITYTQIRKIRKNLVRSLLTISALSVLLVPAPALAQTYGSGNYDTCSYQTSCPTKKPTSSGSSTPTTPTTTNILLNDFSEYFTDSGKELILKPGQVVNFDITVNGTILHKSITVVAVTDSYVDITITMDSANLSVRLYPGDSHTYDVNNDNIDDIKVKLNSVSNGQADMTFTAVLGTSVTPPSSNGTKTPAKVLPATKGSNWWIWLVISIVLILLALFIFFLLKRRKKKDEQPPPYNPIAPSSTPMPPTEYQAPPPPTPSPPSEQEPIVPLPPPTAVVPPIPTAPPEPPAGSPPADQPQQWQ